MALSTSDRRRVEITTPALAGASHIGSIVPESISVRSQQNGGSRATFYEWVKGGSPSFELGARVLILDVASNDDRTVVFDGNVYSRLVEHSGETNVGTRAEYDCRGADFVFDRFLFNRGFEGDTDVDDVLDALMATGIADEIDYTAIGTGQTIADPSWQYAPARDVLDHLTDLLGLAWRIDVDTTTWRRSLVIYDRSSADAAPFSLKDASLRRYMTIRRSGSLDRYRNRQYVKGIELTSQIVETIKGDASRRSFSVGWPIGAAPTVEVSTGGSFSAQTVGVQGVNTGKQWYWKRGSNVITQASTESVLAANHSVRVSYQGLHEIVWKETNDAEVAVRASTDGGAGVYEAFDEIGADSLEGARTHALALLDRYGEAQEDLEFVTLWPGLRPGQLVDIDVAAVGVDDTYLITSVQARGREDGQVVYTVQATAGADLLQWDEYFRRLRGRQERAAEAFVELQRGVLQNIETTPVFALALRRLNGFYTGPCCRIQRGIGGAVMDFGFNADGFLDVEAVAEFVGGADPKIVTLYDQSGNGRDFTGTLVPFVLDAGDGLPAIQFSTSAAAFLSESGIPPLSEQQWFFVWAPGAWTSGRIYMAADDNSSALGVGFGTFGASSEPQFNVYGDYTSLLNEAIEKMSGEWHADTLLWRSAGGGYWREDGNPGPSHSEDAPSPGVTVFTLGGANVGGPSASNLLLREFLVFGEEIADADRAIVEASQAASIGRVAAALSLLSLRKVNARYDGDVLRLRRSSDDAVMDFGFDDDGLVDVDAIETWLSGADGYLTTWYDQSGYARHAEQATKAAQPKLVLAASDGLPEIVFDGSDDYMTTGALGAATDTLHVLSVFNPLVWVAQTTIFDGDRLRAAQLYMHSTEDRLRVAADGVTVAFNVNSLTAQYQQHSVLYSPDGGHWRGNGALHTALTDEQYPDPGVAHMVLGVRGDLDASTHANVAFRELLAYTSERDEESEIEAAQIEAWGIDA